jgi:serine/threonine-protein kinase
VASHHGTEVVKVTDFGLAKLVDLNVQKTAMLAGATVGYAPPEQFEKGNERVTARTDVFSFAAILFECLTGSPAFAAFPGEGIVRFLERMMTGPRPSLANVAHSLASELRDSPMLVSELDGHIARATQPNPDNRPASIREFWDAIEPVLRSASETSFPPGAPVPLAARAGGLESLSPPAADAAAGRYTFKKRGGLPHKDDLRRAIITPDGRGAFALGTLGIYRWLGSTWALVPQPAWLDHSVLSGIELLPDAALLLYGDRGTVVALAQNGEAQPWRLPEDDANLRGALVDRMGIVLVGGRRSRDKGVCVEAVVGRAPTMRTIETTSILQAVARLTSGALVACGNEGALARIDVSTSAAIPWGRTGHLLAIAARPDGGAFVVGSGGHALTLSANWQASLEAVQTTRDLTSVTVAPDGSAWASSTHRRILQRRGTTWARVPLNVEMADATSILAVQPVFDSVVVVASDGQVLEGRLNW